MTIPENVTIIGNSAFYGCTGLTGVTISQGVTSIGDYAFYECTGLTDVTIPERVTTIGNSVFYNCTGLTNVYWNATYATVGSDVFRYAGRDSGGIDVVFGSDVLYIPENLFCDEFSYNYNYDSESYEYGSVGSIMLKSVTVGEYIVSIGDNAFYGCRKLENITWNTPYYADKALFVCCGQDSGGINVVFGDCVTDIPNLLDSATASKVKTVSAVGVTSIGERAFGGWSALERIDLTTAVTSIGDYAFEGCTALKSMTLPDVTEDFDRIYIPEEVTEIGKGAFRDCTALTAVILPDGITEIGDNTFRGCTALTEINIPGGVTKIDRDAFNDCTNMKHVSIDDLAAWCNIEFKLGNESPTISSPLSWGERHCMSTVNLLPIWLYRRE